GGIVVEGRDIGSVVAPDATIKIYLVADSSARAERRAAETGVVDARTTNEQLTKRDRADSTRAASPLEMAADATLIDNTDMSLENVIDRIIGLVEEPV